MKNITGKKQVTPVPKQVSRNRIPTKDDRRNHCYWVAISLGSHSRVDTLLPNVGYLPAILPVHFAPHDYPHDDIGWVSDLLDGRVDWRTRWIDERISW